MPSTGSHPTQAFLKYLFLGLCFWLFPLHALANGAPKRVVILQTLSSPFLQKSTIWFRAEMTRLGYKDGTNISYTVLDAKGDYGLAKSLLTAAIDKSPPDLVVTVATLATRAGRDLLSGTTIPQMFLIVTDPVGEGFVSEMGKTSGSNITGQSHVVPVESQLALVSQILETAKRDTPFRIGILRSTYPSAASEAAQLLIAANQFPAVSLIDLGFPYLSGDSRRQEMNKSAVELVKVYKDKLDGLWLVAGPNQSDLDFVNAVLATGMPIVNSGNIRNARLGAMLALLSTVELNSRAAAEAASAILSGIDPADIPVTRPSKFIAGVNVLTAARLGAVIPSSILELAQENVFHRQGRGN
tara:strand:- start:3105 stop:4172 length:1068 start_codon:yes stop_codon:yes gene_type:complete